jgi:hypothetical protein
MALLYPQIGRKGPTVYVHEANNEIKNMRKAN